MKKLSIKCISAFVLVLGILSGCLGASAATDDLVTSEKVSSVDNVQTLSTGNVVPFDLEIAEGSVTGSQFTRTVAATSRNGKKLNFWVHNRGTTSVVISIDDKATRTLSAGEQGHISVDVGFFTRNYTCKAVPARFGGSINIMYRIAQRDVA